MRLSSCRHNDLAYQIRVLYKNQFSQFDLTKNGSARPPEDLWQTDIPRLRAGKLGGQVHMYMYTCRYILCTHTHTHHYFHY